MKFTLTGPHSPIWMYSCEISQELKSTGNFSTMAVNALLLSVLASMSCLLPCQARKSFQLSLGGRM